MCVCTALRVSVVDNPFSCVCVRVCVYTPLQMSVDNPFACVCVCVCSLTHVPHIISPNVRILIQQPNLPPLVNDTPKPRVGLPTVTASPITSPRLVSPHTLTAHPFQQRLTLQTDEAGIDPRRRNAAEQGACFQKILFQRLLRCLVRRKSVTY